jgi:hypothetical protein
MAVHDLDAVAFPTLTDSQIRTLGRCAGAVSKHRRDGERLFEVGDCDFQFFVVLTGARLRSSTSPVSPRRRSPEPGTSPILGLCVRLAPGVRGVVRG